MSFPLILGGIFILFGSVISGALVILNAFPPQIYIILSIVIGILGGLLLLLTGILANGIIGPFMAAKLRGKDIIAVITAGKKIQILDGVENNGIIHTKRGGFIEHPDTSYTWPNGVNGGIAYYKYGATLPLKIMRGVTKLKEIGIRNMDDYKEVVNKVAREKGKEFVVEL